MKLSATSAIYFKEFKDILRDRRTVVSAVLLPILITPIMMVGFGGFVEHQIKSLKEKPTNIGWIGTSDGAGTRAILEQMPNINMTNLDSDTAIAFEVLRSKELDAIVHITDDFDTRFQAVIAAEDSVAPSLLVYDDKTREKSGFSATMVIQAAEQARLARVGEVLSGYGLKRAAIRPFEIKRVNVADAEKTSKSGLATFLPYFLLIMVFSGAIYPAIDMTAGEKERGTLETLLVSAVSRADIVAGKFLTVFTISIITAILQLASMAIAFGNSGKIAPAFASEIPFVLSIQDVAILMITILPMAVIFSALLMVIGIFAKTYREAQTYIAPMMFVVIFASMMSLFPSEPGSIIAFIPVVNISLLMKQALIGQMETSSFLLTMATNVVVALLALYFVFSTFRKESVLFRI